MLEFGSKLASEDWIDELFLCYDWSTKGVYNLISSQDHCQRSSPSWISVMLQAGFEPVQNLSFRLSWMKLCSSDNHYTTVPWSCAVVITTTPRCCMSSKKFDATTNTTTSIFFCEMLQRNATQLLSPSLAHVKVNL